MIDLKREYLKFNKLVFIYAIGLLISGCASAQHDAKEPRIKEMDLSQSIDLKGPEFSRAIAQLEAQTSSTTDRSFQRKAHLRLAMLYLDNNNPAPQFMAALKELDLYIAIDPVGGSRPEIQNLIRVLRELGRVVDDNRKMKARIEHLVKENTEIKNTFEDLKKLDLRMEEKRRKVK